MVWFAEYFGGKIGRFDPAAQTFKEFSLPGPRRLPMRWQSIKTTISGTPRTIWTSSAASIRNRKVTEFPYAHSEKHDEGIFLDAQGRMWYGSGPNNKVGYFVPADLD